MGSSKFFLSSTVLTTALLASVTAVLSQTADNEVWIGQTGLSNTIGINQEGEGNKVGADDGDFNVGQDGSFNAITIDQYGWANEIGARFGSTVGDPVGFTQTGNGNTANLTQENGNAAGFNIISTVDQSSQSGSPTDINQLTISQSGSGFQTGVAGHTVDTVIQVHTLETLLPNTLTIDQRGGGAAVGNEVTRILQSGAGNSLSTTQTDAEQIIGYIDQIGLLNDIAIEQSNGDGNVIEEVDQYGELNAANILQNGFRNHLLSVFQSNEGVDISGNTVDIQITGDDNGGDGFGGVGYFGTIASAVEVEQGTVLQIGDDNDLQFAVTRGDLNLFGAVQTGDGNGLSVLIDGDSNEVASLQNGDDNDVAITIKGDSNISALTIEGERNRVKAFQTGTSNVTRVSIEGNDNNGFTTQQSFPGLAAIEQQFPQFDAGLISQTGLENDFSLSIFGDANLTTLVQNGDMNVAEMAIVGSGNASAISQDGDMNIAYASQTGSGNTIIIIQ